MQKIQAIKKSESTDTINNLELVNKNWEYLESMGLNPIVIKTLRETIDMSVENKTKNQPDIDKIVTKTTELSNTIFCQNIQINNLKTELTTAIKDIKTLQENGNVLNGLMTNEKTNKDQKVTLTKKRKVTTAQQLILNSMKRAVFGKNPLIQRNGDIYYDYTVPGLAEKHKRSHSNIYRILRILLEKDIIGCCRARIECHDLYNSRSINLYYLK